LDSFCPASGLAVLLMARAGCRSLFAARDGLRCVPSGAFLRSDSRILGGSLQESGSAPPASDLRPGHSVHCERLQTVVPTPRHPPPLRRRRQVRQLSRDREVHPNPQDRMHPAIGPRPPQPRLIPPGAGPLLLLVQRPSAAYPARWRYPRRDLPRSALGRPSASLRAPPALAETITVRRTSGSRPRSARRWTRYRSSAPRRTATPAHRHAQARRVEPTFQPAR